MAKRRAPLELWSHVHLFRTDQLAGLTLVLFLLCRVLLLPGPPIAMRPATGSVGRGGASIGELTA